MIDTKLEEAIDDLVARVVANDEMCTCFLRSAQSSGLPDTIGIRAANQQVMELRHPANGMRTVRLIVQRIYDAGIPIVLLSGMEKSPYYLVHPKMPFAAHVKCDNDDDALIASLKYAARLEIRK